MKSLVSLACVIGLVGGLVALPGAACAQGDFSWIPDPYSGMGGYYDYYGYYGASPYWTGYGSYDYGWSGYGSCDGYSTGWYQPGYGGQYQAGYGPSGSPQEYSQGQPSMAPQFGQAPVRVGERVQPAAPNTQLMVGDQVVGTTSPGQILPVWDVQGPWVGTAADVNGQEVRGWIHIDQLAPVSVATTQMR